MGRRQRRVATIATGIVSMLLLTGCAGADAPFNGLVREDPLVVGQVSLPDVTTPEVRGGGRLEGDRLVFAAAPDRLLVVSFGFLNCPDICPTTLLDVRAALRALDEDERAAIDVVFVTVDPDRDRPEDLAAYLRHFFASYHAVRGTEQELQVALEAFLASASVTVDDEGRVEVAHTAVVYVVDADGLVRIEWPFGTTSEAMAQDLRRALASGLRTG